MKKTCGQVCAEIIKANNKTEWDAGMLDIGLKMYRELQRKKLTKTKIKQPLEALFYVSNILLHDTKSKHGCWYHGGKASYRGFYHNHVTVFKLRDEK